MRFTRDHEEHEGFVLPFLISRKENRSRKFEYLL